MKKRTLVLLLCLALVALVAVNDTLATTVQGWFKDLSHWLKDGSPTTDDDLNVDIVTSNTGVLTPAHYPGEFDWDAVQPVQKTTCAKNTAEENAFVRICIAVKNDDVLMVRPPETVDGYKSETRVPTGKDYTLYTYDYTGTLATGATTPEIVFDFALVKETTNEDLADLGAEFVRVQSFAIEADAFSQLNNAGEKITDQSTDKNPMSPTTALEYALGDIENFNPFN